MTRLSKVRNVLFFTLILNISVAMAKLLYGYVIRSVSMLSDGLHSFFDGTSNIIGIVAIWIASRPADENHPYGHRKFENLSVIAIAVLIFTAGFEILRESYSRLKHPVPIEVTPVGFLIMGLTLMVNISVMTYERKKGKELGSAFLIADAMHTQTDIFISLSVVASLVAAAAGYPVVDVIAAVIITIFIVKMGFKIIKPAADVLTDAACIDPGSIKKLVEGINSVCECHDVRTRGSEDAVHIDLHVLVEPDLSAKEAHDIAHSVEERIRKTFPSVIDVIVHVEPYNDTEAKLGR